MVIGQPRRRVEDPRLLRGQGCYVDDVRLPGALWLAVLRSPYPHGRVGAVEVDAARRAPGVVDVLVGRETAHLVFQSITGPLPGLRVPPEPPLAVNEVRYVGEPVAAVLAESPALAADALEHIVVEYEPLVGVADAEAAVLADAPRVHPELDSNVAYELASGSEDEAVDEALRAADHVVRLRARSPRVAAVPLEPRVFAATVSDERLEVFASSQAPNALRARLAQSLGLPLEQVHVVARDVGGGFGVKIPLYREDLLVAYLAHKHRRAVRWTASRGEDLLTTQQARDQTHEVEAGFSRSGELLALRVRIVANLGAYLLPSTTRSGWRASRMICGPYRVPLARGEVRGVFTTTAPTGVYRGAGRPEATLSVEQALDAAARDLGIDAFEIRRRNLLRPDELPYTTPTDVGYDAGDYLACVDAASTSYAELCRLRDEARAAGRLFGVGVCTFVDPSGGVGGEFARVQVCSGRVTVFSGSMSQGQGHATTFAQIAADQLQVPLEQVEVIQGDTDQVAAGVGTFAARSTHLGGSAVHQAGRAVLDQLRQAAAERLEVPLADLQYANGQFFPTGVPHRRVSVFDLGTFEQMVHFEEPREPHAFGCHLAAVSVDADTGRPTLEAYVAVDDAGVLINPLIADGQMHGGLAQGIGQAAVEHMVFAADGTVLSASLGDYAVPRATDLPRFDLTHTVTPTPVNPLGARGLGESGTVAAPAAVASAVLDALQARSPKEVALPLSAERVWRLS